MLVNGLYSGVCCINPCLGAGKSAGGHQAGKKKGWSLPFAAPRPKLATQEKHQDASPCHDKPAMQLHAECRDGSRLAERSKDDVEEGVTVKHLCLMPPFLQVIISSCPTL